MGNIFAKAKPVAADKVEDDYIGGGGGVLDTDIYTGIIKYAYIGKAPSSDARALNLCINFGGKEISRTIWMTNRDGEVTYKDKKTGDIKNLPGYNQVNSLCMIVASKEVGQMDVEEKTLSLYDYDAQKEIPQTVDCFVELHGEEVQVAVQRQTIDKTKKNDATGDREPTGETMDVNEFVKYMPAGKAVTISEIAHYIESLGGDFNEVLEAGDLPKAIAKMDDDAGQYAPKWLEKNRGQTWNRATGAKAEGKSFKGGAAGGAGAKAKKSDLFDD